jgi:hypothetical protein
MSNEDTENNSADSVEPARSDTKDWLLQLISYGSVSEWRRATADRRLSLSSSMPAPSPWKVTIGLIPICGG